MMSAATPEYLPLEAGHFDRELDRIARWWLDRAPDATHGGFVGEIDAAGRPRPEASRSLVLVSRILWFFSEMGRRDGREDCLRAAERAYACLTGQFHDDDFGGVYWEVSAEGGVLADKKQTYAQAFAIYGCVAWSRASGADEPLQRALGYFRRIEASVRDRRHGGYLEALSRDWLTLYDLRLGDRDLNAPKSANTHLHLLEAYASLHRAVGSPTTAEALGHLVGLFCDRIAEAPHGPLRCFFDSRWNPLSRTQSFGHEIEASWLLCDALEALGDERLAERVRPLVLGLAQACLEHGLGTDGRLCSEWDPDTGTRSASSPWWVQAEALVGFLNADRLTGDRRFRRAAEAVWRHIQLRHIDRDDGEWFWHPPGEAGDPPPYKAGFWKAPYHNGRAMMAAARLLRTPASPGKAETVPQR